MHWHTACRSENNTSNTFLGHHGVVADRFDVVTVMDRLGDAAKLGAEVATTLHRAKVPIGRADQPDLVEANAARAPRLLPDTRNGVVAQMHDGVNAQDEVKVDADTTDVALELGSETTGVDYDTA